MLFYTAESPNDFPVSELDPDAHILLSPTSFHPRHEYRFHHPNSVLIDSGAYVHGAALTPRGRFRTLVEQIRIAEQFPDAQVTLTHCDVLARDTLDPRSVIDETLRNAEWFMAQRDLQPHWKRMLVAQARDPDEYYLVVSELRALAPDLIALGGLTRFVRQDRKFIPVMIEAASEGAGDLPLHALGITAAHVLQHLKGLGIAQCDSATAVWAAVYGNLVYSRPYRRYRLASRHSNQPEARQETSFAKTINQPLACECPVCRTDAQILTGASVRAKYARFIHNYYHLKIEVQGGGPWQEAYSSAEYQSVLTTYLSSRTSCADTAPCDSGS
ncbi:hypothetical protein LAJ19_21600 (plasmid) [Deinococcus taeanensis]|uniref:hypothetical protein n=1 Tax=Deinococcus taeanensis TaxID=2737050 RepID=UPI001CDBF85B|nr:hypothetical protein [Deinococcus taeanensis]UBV45521.1 hypothetical protein LAJ19_21600 [Deinococcus taeanensis]